MGRYQAKKRQEAKKKEAPKAKALEYTTSAGRGKNRVPTKSTGRNWSNPHGQVSSKPSSVDHNNAPKKAPTTPKATPKAATPKTTPKATAPKTTPKATAPKTTPKATAPKTTPKKEASTKKLTPMQQWAKANPGLAKKVKKGQSGYKELKIGRSTKPRSWVEKNYKPGKKK